MKVAVSMLLLVATNGESIFKGCFCSAYGIEALPSFFPPVILLFFFLREQGRKKNIVFAIPC